jgi:hypothetical protein
MRWFFPLFISSILWASTAFAADAAGTWKGLIETIAGTAECTIMLIVDGEKISGSLKMDVYGAAIENGRINGDKVSFTVNMDFGKLTYEGVISGDELKFIVSASDGSWAPLNCKKQKQAVHIYSGHGLCVDLYCIHEKYYLSS